LAPCWQMPAVGGRVPGGGNVAAAAWSDRRAG
jgi:hypothetical protein